MRTGIYVRVSTEEQAKEGYSIRAQQEKLSDYVRVKDWTLYDTYADEGISGKNVVDRPALNRLLDDIKKGRVENILVFKIDRLTRSTKDLIEMVDFFKEHNCAFNSLIESIDTNSATGRMFLKIIGIFAEFERENLAERIKVGFERKVKEGYSLGSWVSSYGYDRPKGQKIQTVNVEEAEIVKQIYSMFLDDNYSMTKIAKLLNQRGVATKRRGAWCVTNVRQVLENSNYIGRVRYHIHDELTYNEFDGLHDAILDEETFHRAQEKLRTRKKTSRTKYSGEDVYFAGVAVCAKCGKKLSPRHGYKKSRKNPDVIYSYLSYRCFGTARGTCLFTCTHNDLNDAFEAYIENIADIDQDIEYEAADESQKKRLRENERKQIEEAILSQEKHLDQIIEQYVNQNIGFEEYRKMTLLMKEKKQLLQERLNSLKPLEEKSLITKNDIVRNIKENWKHLSDGEKQAFLQAFVKEIVVSRELIRVNQGIVHVDNVTFADDNLI